MEKIIIAAVSKNGVIGKNNVMPWHSKEDLKHFKETTMHYPLTMGRKTFESMGGPLKGRMNIILTRQEDFSPKGDNVKVFSEIKEAYDFCEEQNYEKVFVIGGGKIYEQVINDVDKLIISEMKLEVEGDTYFPKIDGKIWRVKEERDYNDFILKIYVKK